MSPAATVAMLNKTAELCDQEGAPICRGNALREAAKLISSMNQHKNDSLLADETTILRANLSKAVFDRETITIGGGEFDAKKVSDILEMWIRCAMKQGMELAAQKEVKEDRDMWRDTAKELAAEVKRLKEGK